MSNKRPGKGRPKIEDRNALMTHITSRVNAGASVSAAARGGLTVLGYQTHKVGAPIPTVRNLPAATLQRRYRESQAEIAPLVERMSRLPADTRYLGIQPPQFPASLVPTRELKRGRPKKSRAR